MKIFVRSNEQGATLLENAIALPLFLFALLIAIDLLRIVYIKLSLQHVLTEQARSSMVDPNPIDPTVFMDQFNTALNHFNLAFDSARDTIEVCPASSFPCAAILLGQRGEFMHFQARKIVDPIILPSTLGVRGSFFTVEADVLGRNEPP